MADYATIAQVKEHLLDANLDSSYDAMLTSLVTRASRAIDRYTKRSENAYSADSETTRYFSGSNDIDLYLDEFCSVPSYVGVAESGEVDDNTGSGGDYTEYTTYFVYPYNALAQGQPYHMLKLDIMYGTKSVWCAYPKSVKVTAQFGYSATAPDTIVEATIIQTVRWFKRGQQAFMDQGSEVVLGQLKYTGLDSDLEKLLYHYIRGVI